MLRLIHNALDFLLLHR